MFHRKLMEEQLGVSGVRIGDSCSISPSFGKKKAFTLNRSRIDLISPKFRPEGLSMAYLELPSTTLDPFHYRLELDEYAKGQSRFLLKTISGRPFWLNGLAAREAYIERQDNVFLDENKLRFCDGGLRALTESHFDHDILRRQNLMESSLNVLIEGETGTGKTDLARKIHEKSGRLGPFVAVNLSAYNPQLIESELFGHKKGSFTGAVSDKSGAFSLAHHGTLFLDEVDSLPWEIQTKLLCFLDSKSFRRVGDMRELTVNTRLIFASGRKLSELVERGEFRKDFFYRLHSGQAVELLPLRANTDRIREACRFFALKHGVSFSERVLDFYQTLAWPGNLRELFGHLEKKKVLSRSTKLDFDAVDEELLLKSSDLLSFSSLEEMKPMQAMKVEYAKKAMALCDGNAALAARKLRLTEKTVRNLLGKVS